MFLLGNVGQQMDIDEVKDYLNAAIAEINQNQKIDLEQAAQIERLTIENRELKLYTLALVRLLSSKGIITQLELNSIVATVENTGPQK